MSLEKCKLCKEEGTPWEMIPELNGHICLHCSYHLCSLDNEFEHYKAKSKRIIKDLDLRKRITQLLIVRWGNK